MCCVTAVSFGFASVAAVAICPFEQRLSHWCFTWGAARAPAAWFYSQLREAMLEYDNLNTLYYDLSAPLYTSAVTVLTSRRTLTPLSHSLLDLGWANHFRWCWSCQMGTLCCQACEHVETLDHSDASAESLQPLQHQDWQCALDVLTSLVVSELPAFTSGLDWGCQPVTDKNIVRRLLHSTPNVLDLKVGVNAVLSDFMSWIWR